MARFLKGLLKWVAILFVAFIAFGFAKVGLEELGDTYPELFPILVVSFFGCVWLWAKWPFGASSSSYEHEEYDDTYDREEARTRARDRAAIRRADELDEIARERYERNSH